MVPKVVLEYKNKMKEEYGKELLSLWLFGSWAKGKQNKNSDMDVCLVFRKSNDSLERKIRNETYTMNRLLSPVVFSEKEFANKYSTLAYEIKTYGFEV